MTRTCRSGSFFRRVARPGRSSRVVRSPLAPRMTRVCGADEVFLRLRALLAGLVEEDLADDVVDGLADVFAGFPADVRAGFVAALTAPRLSVLQGR